MKDFSVCPRCGAKMKKAIAINEGESEFWYECTRCNAYINSYTPQPHQRDLHTDTHTFIGNFGGYGTGKTLTSRQEIYKHIFLTPNANILIGANVASQYEQTIKRDIDADDEYADNEKEPSEKDIKFAQEMAARFPEKFGGVKVGDIPPTVFEDVPKENPELFNEKTKK